MEYRKNLIYFSPSTVLKPDIQGVRALTQKLVEKIFVLCWKFTKIWNWFATERLLFMISMYVAT